MFRSSILKKTVAVTLLFCFLNNILVPGIAFALTSGPENPNATSFEPVDTTDMVNLFSGDLAYNIPLLDIPGPEGGYPLSLSYHAGIMPGEEASWVGLGWGLNPGAINRTVNGFPDDFNGEQNVVRDYWAGGERTTTSVGVNVGIIGALSAEIGLTVSHDTFLGTGIGGFVGLSAGFNLVPGVGASASIGLSVDPFGGTSITGGLGVGVKLAGANGINLNGGIGLGFSANSKGISVGMGADISASLSRGKQYENSAFGDMSTSLLGASLGSGGGGVSLSAIGGYSSVENVNAGRIQTKTRGWGITIPVWFGISISLKRNYVRYWSDETASVPTYGTLNYPATKGEAPYRSEFDTYYLADINDPNYSLLAKNDPIKSNGGTFPDYDVYSVLGQGIGGYIRPYGYQLDVVGKGKHAWRGNTTNRGTVSSYTEMVEVWDSYEERYYWEEQTFEVYHTNNPSKLNFRFVNDFSNSYTQQDTDFSGNVMNFDLTPKYGNNDGNYGYDPASERLASSRNIEYFSNDEIKNGSAKLKGFINTAAVGFDRARNPNGSSISSADKRIGGFMVTNESGVTYHYALPVYAYDESTRTENISGVNTYNLQSRANPYATSWLLTAVTGPDYVDINSNGLTDQGDWGYWVSFEYGKWSQNYTWRNPGLGFKKDLDARFKYHSSGKKELYYLDAVVTPSHTALFEKEIRADGKGTGVGGAYTPYDGLPTSELRLNNILLFTNSSMNRSLADIRSSSGRYNKSTAHLGYNVVDKYDIEELPDMNGQILRKINFGYDYSLCPKTPNSFDENGSIYEEPNVNTIPYPRLGKLTLNSLTFLGKGGEASVPPMEFDYDIPTDLIKSSNKVVFNGKKANSSIFKFSISNVLKDSNEDFKPGDIIKFSFNGALFYGLIKQADDLPFGAANFTKNMEVKFLDLDPPIVASSDQYSWTTTKNPPYNSDNYDMWGMFKADYQFFVGNENLSRLPSKASSQSADVWSLRRIHHALGMTTDIVYESDTYSRVALYRNASIQVSGVEKINDTFFRAVSTGDFGIDLRDFIKPGDKVQLSLTGTSQYDEYGDNGLETRYVDVTASSGEQPTLIVTEVGENFVIINDAAFCSELFPVQSGSSFTSFHEGNMSAGGIGNNLGGGLRVKSVINNEPITGVSMAINYNYNLPHNIQLSSGTTAYEPLGVDLNVRIGNNPAYQKTLLKSFSKLLGVARDIPAPGVMYEFVSVTSERTSDGQKVQQIGKSQYQFEIFNEGMIGLKKLNQQADNYKEYSKITLKNYTSRIGNLRRIIKYDGDGSKLSETINHYLHDEQLGNSARSNEDEYGTLLAKYNNQGLVMERIAEGRYNDGKSRLVMTTRATFPTVATGTTSIDYKTGIQSGSQTLAYDFYSGQPIKTLTIDGMGNRFVSEKKSAYRIYPEMGLKFNNSKNANMLIQIAEELVFKVDQNNNPIGVMSASANTWSNQLTMLNDEENKINTKDAHSSQPNIWRKHQAYQWMPQTRGGAMTSLNDFASIFNGGANLPGWSLTSEITLYNRYSSALELKDINNHYAATRMGYNQSKVVATASASRYYEMNYSGFEDGEIKGTRLAREFSLGGAVVVSNLSHTGNKSARLSPGKSGVSYTVNGGNLKPGRSYSASVWMKNTGDPLSSNLYYRINGGTLNYGIVDAKKKAGEWYQVNLQIPGNLVTANVSLEIGCINNGTGESYFDDLRFKPINASMNAYVYNNNTGELDYTLDNNNIFTKFLYDSQGRLTKTYRETFGYGVKLITESTYNYAKSLKAIWQFTSNMRCQSVNSAFTGLREREQMDTNPLSSSYQQYRWVVIGSASECGANPTNCVGMDRKYVNGQCEIGTKEFVRSEYHQNQGYYCFFVYKFTDGTSSSDFFEVSLYGCEY
ncbi:hypothetical protein HQN84_01850 [Pedobacter steynii]|nr:hypothetical protein [Pedobacter steynii]NQX37566.1 hypothetical protein [Pedobacter steynii]